ncbi:MAG TPA: hypothetical protein VEF04_13010 [Blastocatellia bacterium]|nr:hypothetical protein [Blastocatellia bacterium]
MKDESPFNVTFWIGDTSVLSVWLNHIPPYTVGQMIYLDSSVTPKGEQKFKAAEQFRYKCRIKEIVHSIRREYSDDITDYVTTEIHLEQL